MSRAQPSASSLSLTALIQTHTHTHREVIPSRDAKFGPMTFITSCGKNSETLRGIHERRHVSEEQNRKIFVLEQEFNQRLPQLLLWAENKHVNPQTLLFDHLHSVIRSFLCTGTVS